MVLYTSSETTGTEVYRQRDEAVVVDGGRRILLPLQGSGSARAAGTAETSAKSFGMSSADGRMDGEPTAKDITTNININENINFKPPTTRNNDIIHLNGGNTTESTKLEAEDRVVFRNNKIVIRQAILKGDSPVSSDILTRCLGVFALSSCQADTIQVKVFNILEDQYSSKFCFSLATFFQKDYREYWSFIELKVYFKIFRTHDHDRADNKKVEV
ncbi:hypothetical protein J6590_002619 [Homalodisca vitripennis]|nr:hypothetical protein J6590_002619 [Homalodisca vitripennis]